MNLAGFLSSRTSWCIMGGDVNETLNLGERRGGTDAIDNNLCDFVMGLNLIDIPISNGEFTLFSFEKWWVVEQD